MLGGSQCCQNLHENYAWSVRVVKTVRTTFRIISSEAVTRWSRRTRSNTQVLVRCYEWASNWTTWRCACYNNYLATCFFWFLAWLPLGFRRWRWWCLLRNVCLYPNHTELQCKTSYSFSLVAYPVTLLVCYLVIISLKSVRNHKIFKSINEIF
jgi:hypothetical protein